MSTEETGSVGEEAAKLFGVLADLARDQGADLGAGVSGLADRAAATLHDVGEHVATDSPECTLCPVCRTVHVLRRTSPEVRAHLSAAVSSLAQAAAGLLATAVPDETRARAQGAGVEPIDLDDADEWAEDA
ncbi:hypothetical protein [Nocardioides dongkuii]|uniref:hypothetical protein n=1 Tax=Nocardioides dongkuii TaxID=2760089 RepID=UPI0015FBBA08|nr:hypothetical protein [Nocardioides dongkuii]